MSDREHHRGGPASLRDGQYEVHELLGEGAMGQVYCGHDTGPTDRDVAIKITALSRLSPTHVTDRLRRFRLEAKAAGRLIHPNVVQVYDAGSEAGFAYIVMELVRGESLAAKLARDGAMAPAAAISMMHAILSGLQYCHDNNVVHRDLKPANIMLTVNGRPKITDFGIAYIDHTDQTAQAGALGTPAYTAPEQFSGGRGGARSDIYSAGVTLFEMLTGAKPFAGTTLPEIFAQIISPDRPAPSSLRDVVPPELDEVVKKAMALQPVDRFDTAAEFSLALGRAVSLPGPVSDTQELPRLQVPQIPVSPPEAAPTLAPTPMPVAERQVPWGRWASGGAAGLGVVALGAWALWHFSTSNPQLAPRQPSGTVTASPSVGAPGTAAVDQPPSSPSSPGPPARPSQPAGLPQETAAPAIAPPIFVPQTPTPDAQASLARPPDVTEPPVVPIPFTAPPLSPAAQPPQFPPAVPPPAKPPTPEALPVPVPPRPLSLQRLSELAASVPCTLLEVEVASSGYVSLRGIGEQNRVGQFLRDIDDLQPPIARGRLPDIRSIARIDPAFCPVLDLAQASIKAGAERLRLALPNGQAPLRRGTRISPQVDGPGFNAFVAAEYVSFSDSRTPEILHLTINPVRITPGVTVTVGIDRPSGQMLEVYPPFGVDLVFAVASSEPLATGSRGYQSEPLEPAISALRRSIDVAARRGVKLSVGVIAVTTIER